jgi:hypothetical protein
MLFAALDLPAVEVYLYKLKPKPKLKQFLLIYVKKGTKCPTFSKGNQRPNPFKNKNKNKSLTLWTFWR